MPVTYDTLNVTNFLHLETFANLTGSCLEDLQKLNPSLLHNAVPDRQKQFTLNVPVYAKAQLSLNRLAILDSASRSGRKELELLARRAPSDSPVGGKIIYKVKSGDVLGSIAMRNRVRIEDLRKWNNIRGNTIRIGQRLTIWSKSGRTNTITSIKASESTVAMPIPNSKTYIVQPGDTLWTISRKFTGLTIDKIKTLNKLSNNKIQPGQKLIVGI